MRRVNWDRLRSWPIYIYICQLGQTEWKSEVQVSTTCHPICLSLLFVSSAWPIPIYMSIGTDRMEEWSTSFNNLSPCLSLLFACVICFVCMAMHARLLFYLCFLFFGTWCFHCLSGRPFLLFFFGWLEDRDIWGMVVWGFIPRKWLCIHLHSAEDDMGTLLLR